MGLTTRSAGIISLSSEYTFHILGCGAIGSSVATQLARMGGEDFVLYDFDKVAIENVGVSQYTLNDIEPNDYKYEIDNLEYELKTDISSLDYSINSVESKITEIEMSVLNLERNNDFLYTTMISQSELNQLKDEINLLKERVTWLEATPKY